MPLTTGACGDLFFKVARFLAGPYFTLPLALAGGLLTSLVPGALGTPKVG
jgi:hypothetical protein